MTKRTKKKFKSGDRVKIVGSVYGTEGRTGIVEMMPSDKLHVKYIYVSVEGTKDGVLTGVPYFPEELVLIESPDIIFKELLK